VSSDPEAERPVVVAPAGPSLGPVPLRLTLEDPPTQLLTGSRTPIVAVMENIDTKEVLVHCGAIVGLLLDGGCEGPIVGGVYGWRYAIGGSDFRLAAGGRQRCEGITDVRRTTKGPTAPMLPQGAYGLVARLSGIFQRSGAPASEPFALTSPPVLVVVTARRSR
jgi:hypothetical protein